MDLVLAEARQLLGGPHVAFLLDVSLGEDEINLLEGTAGRLGIEEVDKGEEDGIKGGEEEVGTEAARARVVDEHGGDHDDEEVPQPVRHRRYGIGLGPRLERVDLSRVQPRQRQPRGTEKGDIREESDGGPACCARRARNQRPERKYHR